MKIFDHIENIANKMGLSLQREQNSISIWTSPFSGISLTFSCNENEDISFYYNQRTTSWTYNGERTDLHDVIPIVFALFIKSLGLCHLFFTDVFNPATGADDEIYSKFLTPVQINDSLKNKNDDSYLECIDKLVHSLWLFEHYFWNCFPGCPCNECRDKLGYEFEYTYDINEEKLISIKKAINSTENLLNYCERTLPNWIYFRDFEKRISIIQSDNILPFLNKLAEDTTLKSVDGINGQLTINNIFCNYISNKKREEIKKIFKRLNDCAKSIILLENRVVGIGEKFFLSINYDCGINKFQIEKDKLKLRHEKEFQILFRPSSLEWGDKIDDSEFEDLIKDLLEREPDVIRVRKTSHTRERDGGIDLIVDWKVPKERMTRDDKIPYNTLKIIVQCKAYKEGVSKSHVYDIRDTIEYRNYDGYFLAVSSYLKKSLSDHLDKIRTDGRFWIDWWGRDEIEKRLKNNRDLIVKYSNIVKIKE